MGHGILQLVYNKNNFGNRCRQKWYCSDHNKLYHYF